MSSNQVTSLKEAYPSPYYASYDVTAPQPTPVTGWYSVYEMSSLDNVPPAKDMIPLTRDEWTSFSDSQKAFGLGVMGGKIVEYAPPPPVISIVDKARNALQAIQSQAGWMFVRGQKFGPTTNAYIDTLNSIIDGKVTAESLPEAPSDLTV